MKKLLIFSVLLFCTNHIFAQHFSDFFCDRTLRIDYIFAGNQNLQNIYVDELFSIPRWYGKRQHLAEVPLRGSGQIIVRTAETQQVIYRNSFSTLFQEWLATDEARQTQKSFENVFLVPYPKQPIDVTIELYDYHNHTNASMTHRVDPKDILIRKADSIDTMPYKTLQQASDTSRCIHIAFVAEGYQADEMPRFIDACRVAMESLFAHEPFKHLKSRFNIVAVESPSVDSGASEPGSGLWRNTVLGSHFDTFYSNRYLTTLHLKRLHDVLAGTPYEHIIVLVNTDRYGGGGIYNSYNLTYVNGTQFRPVVVHEFGHSFGGLADEYPYGDDDPMYFADTEPWEPNLTTKCDFNGKWENLIQERKAGFIEGGGCLAKGVWRGFENCRMRTNEEPEFCLVCQQWLERLINFYTQP